MPSGGNRRRRCDVCQELVGMVGTAYVTVDGKRKRVNACDRCSLTMSPASDSMRSAGRP
jgi:hypothetical protein